MDKPSKTERKRQQHALQELGEYLITLNSDELAAMRLNDELLEAVEAAIRMKSHEALRRQKQFIGKLMRTEDAERIQARLDAIKADERAQQQLFAKAEKWRDRVLGDDANGLAAFEALTGAVDTDLRSLLAELEVSFDERREKTIKRQVFRHIHAVLVKIPA